MMMLQAITLTKMILKVLGQLQRVHTILMELLHPINLVMNLVVVSDSVIILR